MNRAKAFYETVLATQLQRLESPGIEMWAFPMHRDAAGCADLYATADIQLPRALSKDQRHAWEQIRKYESRN